MSVEACGFDDFYNGSSKCSNISLTSIDTSVVEQCSLLGSSPSFDVACGSCTSAISSEVGKLLSGLKAEGSGVEEAVCGVAVIVAVVAGTMNRTAGVGSDDLDRCLPALSKPGTVTFMK